MIHPKTVISVANHRGCMFCSNESATTTSPKKICREADRACNILIEFARSLITERLRIFTSLEDETKCSSEFNS